MHFINSQASAKNIFIAAVQVLVIQGAFTHKKENFSQLSQSELLFIINSAAMIISNFLFWTK